MSSKTDPALYGSDYERLSLDRYWTEPWVTQVLVDSYLSFGTVSAVDTIWEPAAGRGDLAGVLGDAGYPVLASDLDVSELDLLSDRWVAIREPWDFLTDPVPPILDPVGAIATNPPYRDGLSVRFVERALEYLRDPDSPVTFVAMLLRTEFASAATRNHLFTDPNNHFACEIRLTRRPWWDWWRPNAAQLRKDGAGPRHNFSWYVWDKYWEVGTPAIMWAHGPSKEE